MRQEAGPTFDWSGHELWEERDIKCEINEIAGRVHILAVDINDIADCLESEKADPNGKQNL